MTYTIILQDAPTDITDRARREAEERFGKALERALGGPGAMPLAYRAWQQTEDAVETGISAEDMMLAKHWIAAATRARNDGFRDFGESIAAQDVALPMPLTMNILSRCLQLNERSPRFGISDF